MKTPYRLTLRITHDILDAVKKFSEAERSSINRSCEILLLMGLKSVDRGEAPVYSVKKNKTVNK